MRLGARPNTVAQNVTGGNMAQPPSGRQTSGLRALARSWRAQHYDVRYHTVSLRRKRASHGGLLEPVDKISHLTVDLASSLERTATENVVVIVVGRATDPVTVRTGAVHLLNCHKRCSRIDPRCADRLLDRAHRSCRARLADF